MVHAPKSKPYWLVWLRRMQDLAVSKHPEARSARRACEYFSLTLEIPGWAPILEPDEELSRAAAELHRELEQTPGWPMEAEDSKMLTSSQQTAVTEAFPDWKPHEDYGIVRTATIPIDGLRKLFTVLIDIPLNVKLTKGLWLLGSKTAEMVVVVEIGLHSSDMGSLFKATNALNAEFNRFKRWT